MTGVEWFGINESPRVVGQKEKAADKRNQRTQIRLILMELKS